MNTSMRTASLSLSPSAAPVLQDVELVSLKKSADESMDILSTGVSMIAHDFNREEIRKKLLKDYQVEEFISGGLWTWYESRIYKVRELKTKALFALSMISLRSPRFGESSTRARLEGIDKEVNMPKRMPSDYATQTFKRIDLPESKLVALIQELADADMGKIQCEIDNQKFLIMVRQCLELYHFLDTHRYEHCDSLGDILYFKSQGRVKLSALEEVMEIEPGEHNNLDAISRLVSNFAGWECFKKGTKPDWMSEASYRFACDFQDGKYKAAGDALQTEIMQSVIDLPLVLELKKSNFEEVTSVEKEADEDS